MLKNFFSVFTKNGKNEYSHTIFSPDGKLAVEINLSRGKIFYSLTRSEKSLVKKSELGLDLAGETPFGDDLSLVREQTKHVNEKWETIWGEEREITNQYTETAFYFAEQGTTARIFTIRVRVFNNGIGFRYELPVQPKYRQVAVVDEKTEFNIDPNSQAWQIPAYQFDRYEYNYEKTLALYFYTNGFVDCLYRAAGIKFRGDL